VKSHEIARDAPTLHYYRFRVWVRPTDNPKEWGQSLPDPPTFVIVRAATAQDADFMANSHLTRRCKFWEAVDILAIEPADLESHFYHEAWVKVEAIG
jgi:hypothetical protein